MPRKKAGEAVHDNRPVGPTLPVIRETRRTLTGPGPCERCGGAKFNHRPHLPTGIPHAFQARTPAERAIAVALKEDR